VQRGIDTRQDAAKGLLLGRPGQACKRRHALLVGCLRPAPAGFPAGAQPIATFAVLCVPDAGGDTDLRGRHGTRGAAILDSLGLGPGDGFRAVALGPRIGRIVLAGCQRGKQDAAGNGAQSRYIFTHRRGHGGSSIVLFRPMQSYSATLAQSAEIWLLPAAVVLGLLVGSFLNVVIARLPVMMEHAWQDACADIHGHEAPARDRFNLAWPRSHCPSCRHALSWHELVPVLSWLWQRGRCRHCNASVSWR